MERTHSSSDAAPPASSAGFQLRRAERSDMGRIAAFVRSSADWYREICDPDDMDEHDVGEEWAERNFALREFYVGSADGEPVGTISLQWFGQWMYLGYIYLDVAHVGKGYGARLMEFAKQEAERRGAEGLCLIAHPDATWARKAYLKFGFDITRQSKPEVLAWNHGALEDYYEEGFEFYQLPLRPRRAPAPAGPAARETRVSL